MILHIFMDTLFVDSYIDFVKRNFDNNHKFLILQGQNELRFVKKSPSTEDVVVIKKTLTDIFVLIKNIKKSRKIIIHGMFSYYLLFLLTILRSSSKCYWFLYGGDYYDYKKENIIQRKLKLMVCKNIAGVICEINDEIDLAEKIYGFSTKRLVATYPSNFFVNKQSDEFFLKDKSEKSNLTILIGNSADPSNNHFVILNKLKEIVSDKCKLVIPLSYGDKKYAEEVSRFTKENFNNEIILLKDIMEYSEYINILKNVDIALFAHKRQQAVGNITQLLGYGAKVYLNSFVNTYKFYKNKNLYIFDVEDLGEQNIKQLSFNEMLSNHNIMVNEFSEKSQVIKWKSIFK